jgi:hypothetical protein
MPIDYTRRGPRKPTAGGPAAPGSPLPAGPASAPRSPSRPPRPGGRRRRSPSRWVLLTVVLVAVAGGAAFAWHRAHAGLADPATVALPPAPTAPAASAYLNSTGQPVVRFTAAVPATLRGLTAAQCSGVGDALDEAGSPGKLDELATDIPDPTLQTTAVSAISATAEYLGGCLAGTPDDRAARTAEFQLVVLRRLLAQAGVAA